MEEKIKVGVIGLRMGLSHIEGYRRNPYTEVYGICDTDEKLLEKTKQEYNIKIAVNDYKELINIPEISIISIASPDFFHCQQAIYALKNGKNVLCEKPMTPTIEEAKEIVKVVKETGKKFMVGQVCRYAPGFVLAKKMVENGDIGELFFVESEYAHDYSKTTGIGNWRKDKRREPFLGGGCHAVDLLRWIAGDPIEVSAYSNHKCLVDWPVDDCTIAIYKFPDGVIGKVFVSIGCIRPYTMRSVFYGKEGTIICDNTSPQIYLCSKKYYREKSNFNFASFPVNLASHNVSAEIDEFVDCIINNKEVPTNEIEGAKTVISCLKAVESAKKGKPLKIGGEL
ncbi:MAG TPA: Gfo/Idh/MocA family oxidoreductase [bacterium]|nr:Gfo/Idh/MocA family oxidoreductase [bacterium]